MSASKKPEPSASETEERKERPEPWSSAIFSGLVSAVIAGLSAGFGGGKLGFGAWIVCYILFLHWLKPFSRKFVAIAIMLSAGALISVIIQNVW